MASNECSGDEGFRWSSYSDGRNYCPRPAYVFSIENLFKSTGLSERFTQDRLLKLQQYFHMDDTSCNPPRRQPGHDKLAHTRHVMTVVNDRCKNAFHPHREVSIDEAMIAYTGRLGFKQYVPMKPTKHGLKVWMRAEPHNGYVNEFQVYTGREGAAERGLGERVVKDLSQSILGQNHHLFIVIIILHLWPCLNVSWKIVLAHVGP